MKSQILAVFIAVTLGLTGCGGSVSEAPPAAASSSAAFAGTTALGDRKAPFDSTTAVSVIEAAQASGLSVGPAQEDTALCGEYKGCRSAALTGSVKVVVFETAAAAQQYRSTPEGAAIEKIGGRRYWSLVDYRELGPEERSTWRDVQRRIIP